MTRKSGKRLARWRDEITDEKCPECGSRLFMQIPVLSSLDKAFLVCRSEGCSRARF